MGNYCKYVLAAVSALALASGSALAAKKKQPPADPPPAAAPTPYSWTGFYVGLNAGVGLGQSNTDASYSYFFIHGEPNRPPLLTASNNVGMDGMIGGFQVGGNWQIGKLVWGIEGDLQSSGQHGSTTFTCAAGTCSSPGINTNLTSAVAERSQQLHWFGTARGRMGVTLSPMNLTYLTGGLAWGRITTEDILTANGTVAKLVDSYQFNSGTTKVGWTVGLGAEERFLGNWTAKIEYLFMDFGRVSSSEFLFAGNVTTNSVGLLVDLRSKFTNNVLRTGISYSF